MSLPGFGAEFSLGKSQRIYRGQSLYEGFSEQQTGQPAIVLPSQLPSMNEITNAYGIEDEDLEDLLEAIRELDDLDGSEEDLANWVDTVDSFIS